MEGYDLADGFRQLEAHLITDPNRDQHLYDGITWVFEQSLLVRLLPVPPHTAAAFLVQNWVEQCCACMGCASDGLDQQVEGMHASQERKRHGMACCRLWQACTPRAGATVTSSLSRFE